VGDKWTMLIVRDLAAGPRRMTELLAGLHPMSSRTLADRLRDMKRDGLVERHSFGGSPPRVEYALTERGRLLTPLLETLRAVGRSLDCNECEDRLARHGAYCDFCPRLLREQPASAPPARRASADDSIVLL
jgi:DNA-binding HxlR family transcriptional regulator